MSRESKSNQRIDEHISRAMFQLRISEGTAEEADALWEVPVEKATGDEWYLQGTSSYTGRAGEKNQKTENKSKSVARRFRRSEIYRMVMATAAAVLIIAGISYYQYFVRVDATVCLDINPSVTLSENRVGRVVSAEANNSDAETVLSEAEPKGKKTDEAVEEILNLMVEEGYITDEDSTVLVSVECGDSARNAQKVREMTELVGNCIKNDSTEGSVFSQTISMNDEVREFAKEESVSAGKAALVLQLAGEHPEMNARELAALPMNDLVRYLHGQNVDLRDVIDYKGEDLDARWQKEDEQKQKESQESSGAAGGSAGSLNQEERGSAGNNSSANAEPGNINNNGAAGNNTTANNQEAANNSAGMNVGNNQPGTTDANSQESTKDQTGGNNQADTNEPAAENGGAVVSDPNASNNRAGANETGSADSKKEINGPSFSGSQAGTDNPGTGSIQNRTAPGAVIGQNGMGGANIKNQSGV